MVKPKTLSLQLFMAGLLFISSAAYADTHDTLSSAPLVNDLAITPADSWIVYGTGVSLQSDPEVAGAGSLTALQPRSAGEPWSAAAVSPVPFAVRKGEVITVSFYAKSDVSQTIPVTLQKRVEPYTPFMREEAVFDHRWKLFQYHALASESYEAGSQLISLQLGEIRSPISLGPLAFEKNMAVSKTHANPFSGYRPDRSAQSLYFDSEPGVRIAGTLRLPVGKGPYPLSILIQGTGPNLRGSFVELIDRLSSEGIATLEYDKRGTGVSTGKYEENNDKLIADARMVLAAMMKRTDIDQRKITIIGHSQGAIIAPALAFENPQIAAIVNLAGGVGDGIDIVSGGMRQTLLDAGKKPEAIETLVNAVTKLVEAKTAKANDQILTILRTEVVNGFIANDFSAEDAKGALAKIDNDDLQQIAQLRLGTQLKSVAMPVLQVFGSLDPIVASKYFAVEASKLLAHNPKSKVVMLDGLSHWFVEGAVTGSAQENATLGGNANSPRLIALVATWLSGILAIDADVKSIP